MKNTIYCKSGHDTLNFYLCSGGEELYLFTARYNEYLYRYFRKPISADSTVDFSKSNSKCVHNAMKRLRSYSGFVLAEYGVEMFGSRKRTSPYSRSARRERFSTAVCDVA